MRYGWKKHLLASVVSIAVLTITADITLKRDTSLGKRRYLDLDADAYDTNSKGNLLGALIVAIGLVGAVLVPYEVTLRALNIKRFSSEN